MKKLVQIAIDGPSAAGKGTVARLVAERLGILYIDTGAMYRAAALLAKEAGVDWSDDARVARLVEKSKFELRQPEGEEKDGRLITVRVNGEDLSWKIRTEEMSRGSSMVAKLPAVRQELVKKQQEIAKSQSVIMEGRDITYRVLPEADVRIYLTAEVEERAERRQKELMMRGQDITYEKVLEDLMARDKLDMERSVDPLQVVEGVWVLDTTKMKIEEVVAVIVAKVESIGFMR